MDRRDGRISGVRPVLPSSTRLPKSPALAPGIAPRRDGPHARPVISLIQTWLLDAEDVVRKITPRTKAVTAVHLYSAMSRVAALSTLAEQHGLLIIENQLGL
jgi:hypothetical protein